MELPTLIEAALTHAIGIKDSTFMQTIPYFVQTYDGGFTVDTENSFFSPVPAAGAGVYLTLFGTWVSPVDTLVALNACQTLDGS